MDIIKLAHGNGGVESRELIEELFYANFSNDTLISSQDAAIISGKKMAFSTDSFTVNPIFFSGGDIGKLSICGTCNDIAMMGAKPKYISLALIIEEGFSKEMLKKIVYSIKDELAINSAKIVCGDTKVVPKGGVDKIFINTSGVGEIMQDNISSKSIKEGDLIIISRDIGAHGAAIFADREGISLHSGLKSDCASLYPVIKDLIDNNIKVHAMRDATRGGVAAVLNEWAHEASISIEIDEQNVPILEEVEGICEILGFDAYALANEGTFVLALPKDEALKALDILHKHTISHNASCIGEVVLDKGTSEHRVLLRSAWGTKRLLESPSGELLPRIC